MIRDLELTIIGLGDKVREHLLKRKAAGDAQDAAGYMKHSDEARKFLSLIETVLTGSTPTRRLV